MTTRRSDHVPEDATDAVRTPRARWPMTALTIIVAVALVVLAILTWLFLTSRSDEVAADPSASATGPASASPSASVAPSEAPTSPSAAPAASASPTDSGPVASGSPDAPVGVVIPPATWHPIATFGTADQYATSTLLYDLVAWDGGLLAVGRQFDGGPIEGSEIPTRLVAWLSQSGETWTEVEADFGEPDVRVGSIVPLDDGRLLAVGTIGFHQQPPPGEPAQRPAAWISSDGVAWDEVALPDAAAPEGNPVVLAQGAQGYVLAIGGEVWHSDDGLAWDPVDAVGAGRLVFGIAAGDDGFVAVTSSPDAEGSAIIASGDGRTWLEAELPGRVGGLAPLGPDWLATVATEPAGALELWRSANALDWERVLEINDLTGPDGAKSGLGLASGITGARLLSAGGAAYLALTWNHCCVLSEGGVGVYRSEDGETWSDLGLGAAAITEAADGPVGAVLGGILERGDRIGFWLEGH